jgi:DNA-binding NarL/FixJ family response regulator
MLPRAARIVVYDASALHADLLAKGLQSLPLGLDVVPASDAAPLHALLSDVRTGILIVADARMHGGTLAFARKLRARHRDLPMVFLMQEGRFDHVIDAFRIGARGIVYSSESLSQLARCIACVFKGEVWVRRADLTMIFDGLLKPNPRVTDAHGKTLLTPREEEICALVAEGMTNREVSRCLNISESTVKNSLFRVFEKLGISNRVELARYMNGASAFYEAAYRLATPFPESDRLSLESPQIAALPQPKTG